MAGAQQPAAPGDGWGPDLDRFTARIAESLDANDIGRRDPAFIYLRAPFDGSNRVVCPPLSARLAEALRARLPAAFERAGRHGARLVQMQGSGPGQYVLVVNWLTAGPYMVLSFRLGDLGTEQIAEIGSGALPVSPDGLGPEPRACLAPIRVVNRLLTAEAPLFLHRTPSIFSEEIGVIEAGTHFRLLGRVPWAEGDWAVVKPLDQRDEPFGETLGFAMVPPTEAETRRRETPRPQPAEPAPVSAPAGAAEIELVSGRQATVCGTHALRVRVVRQASSPGYRQKIRWYPPGREGSVGIAPGEEIALAPDCRLRLLRTTRKLDLVAIFARLP
ncbi:hypothetical protein LNKW23_06550 [Paralimibaculum aggregatum]|uniref:Uncharacterized protein n=2 Tax=Paralimibaculum aggregatum TaxID=3036245 RepID=A0ABQ6LIF9_9RHOB|nr:hypothetical protein LNKW23_06550 [Limibaculum sp. NKW23]